ncbi:MAG TPA: S-methyl-5-thioribose-1-phosphate isomerase [Thermoanaerobaculia bacterium]|jgi:methylthioribose-1-phosphate isomerase|nr:S-methyl-5-thioribose-1-phosphate isomerase [Thermoanaerobaculia bacterium]
MSESPQTPTPPTAPEPFSPLRWRDGVLELLEQTLLPREEVWLACRTPEEVADAIYRLAVRGAPAIGVAAAYGLVLGLQAGDPGASPEELQRRFDEVSKLLGSTRPTAVNLQWALDRGREVFDRHRSAGREAVVRALLEKARGIHADDLRANLRMGEHGAALFAAGARVLTHCNAGALATAGYGTAIGVITSAWKGGKVDMVWVDETRPLLQGARLTAWELKRLGIPFRLVTDSSSGILMARGHVDRIVVGADRIAANGDTANKIGTYTVAVLAQRHGVPFYVAAPLSTIDRATQSGADIPIEERKTSEVVEVFGTRVAPEDIEAMNFAFDVTPAELITAIITEEGVLEPPYEESIAAAFERQRQNGPAS